MRPRFVASLAALALATCAPQPPQETAWLPSDAFSLRHDNDAGATNRSAWAFASPADTRANPFTAINAVIALEYLSGELKQNPRRVATESGTKLRMRQARDDVRQILGIRADAPVQLVVNALLRTSACLRGGDVQAALHMLSAPIFTRAPEQTLRMLSNIPSLTSA